MIDEIATLIMVNQSPGTIFIEVYKHDKPWLFNIDEHDDAKFYKSVTQAANLNSHSYDQGISPGGIQVLSMMPYLTYNSDEMTDRDFFGGTTGKDTMLWNFNSYWKTRNYIPQSSLRQFASTQYPSAAQFYAHLIPV